MTGSPSFSCAAQRPEHLIRTVVSGNLRGEQQLDDGRVDVNVGTDGAQLVERGDDAVADRPVRLEQAGDERLLGLRGADPQQHRRQLAAHFDRDVLGPAARRRSSAPPRCPAARALRRLPPPAPGGRAPGSGPARSSSRTRRWAARMACRATSALSSAMSGGRRSTNVASWIAPIRRAASARSRRPSGPPLRAMRFDHEPRRVEVLRRARRGKKRRDAGPDREVLEVPELLDLAQRVDAGLAGQIQQRLGANADIRDRAAWPGRGRRSRSSPLALRAASERRRMSASGCVSSVRSAGCHLRVCCPSMQIERVADLRRDRRRRASPRARPPRSVRSPPRCRAPCRDDAGECCPGSCGCTRLAPATPAPARCRRSRG